MFDVCRLTDTYSCRPLRQLLQHAFFGSLGRIDHERHTRMPEQEQGKRTRWLLWLVAISTLVWFLSPLIPVRQLVTKVFDVTSLLMLFIFPIGAVYSKKSDSKSGKQTTEFRWDWKDWLGLSALIVILYAIWVGSDPVSLLKAIGAKLR
jgi:hypothetical protein